MQFAVHGNCCGAKVLYRFSQSYLEMTKTREEKARQVYNQCKGMTSAGIISAILNRGQKQLWHDALLDAGFTMVGEDEPNPNMLNRTFITHYQWLRRSGIAHWEAAHPEEVKKEKKKETNDEARRRRNARRRELYRQKQIAAWRVL